MYPPVGWRDADYPVRVAVRPGRLNRLAVLFRLVLAVPALLVEVVLVLVLVVIVMPITWLIVLSLGRMPQPLYEAISAAARLDPGAPPVPATVPTVSSAQVHWTYAGDN